MSKLYFATESRFVKRDGLYYSLGGFSKTLWERYLKHFDEMVIIARVTSDESIPVTESMLASCDGVRFIELPYYIGFGGYIKNRMRIKRILRNSIHLDGCFICRLPGQIGGLVIDVLKTLGGRYACEVVGNPWDVFAKGSVNHPLRPIIRWMSTQTLKKQLRGASAALYVTEHTLQDMYPVSDGVYSVGVSDVIVKDERMAKTPKVLINKSSYRVISVGSLEQMYKAPDIVLHALKQTNEAGVNCELVWLGDGKFKNEMEALGEELKIGKNVHFKGNVSSDEVIKELRDSDLFLLVSRTEGLPRAVVEAMAQGLPCIGSRVGGIPELLPLECLVEKENVEDLAGKILKMFSNPQFANEQAARNLDYSMKFRESNLNELRNNFFKYIITNLPNESL